MTPEIILQILARLLPSVIVLVLAFIAAGDRGSRERWANLMYQAGSIRADQRDDPKVQRGVRLPFFLVAVVLLYWPFNYYRHATRTLEVKSNLYSSPAPAATPQGTPGAVPGAPGTTAPGTTPGAPGTAPGTAPGAPGASAPSAPPAPSGPTNMYGTPIPR